MKKLLGIVVLGLLFVYFSSLFPIGWNVIFMGIVVLTFILFKKKNEKFKRNN